MLTRAMWLKSSGWSLDLWEARAPGHAASRKWILQTACLSLEVASFPVEPPYESASQPTSWSQPCETLNRRLSKHTWTLDPWKQWGDKHALFQAAKALVICYKNNKLIKKHTELLPILLPQSPTKLPNLKNDGDDDDDENLNTENRAIITIIKISTINRVPTVCQGV